MTLSDAAALKLTPPLLRKLAVEIEGGASVGFIRPSPDARAILVQSSGTGASITGKRQPLSMLLYVLICEDPQTVEAAGERLQELV